MVFSIFQQADHFTTQVRKLGTEPQFLGYIFGAGIENLNSASFFGDGVYPAAKTVLWRRWS